MRLGLLLVATTTACYAQYRFDHWTADNGLPQNSVRDIVQTHDGYLWLTTFDGLVRFDGVRFTVFNKSNSPGIASNRFLILYEDSQGDLWAALETGGLVQRHQGRFKTYGAESGLPETVISSLGDDGQGNLLLLSGTRAFRWQAGRFHPANDLRLPQMAKKETDGTQVSTQHLPYWSDGVSQSVCFVDGQLHTWANTDVPPSIDFHAMQDEPNSGWIVTSKGLTRWEQGRAKQVQHEYIESPVLELRLIFGHSRAPLVCTRDKTNRLWLIELQTMQAELLSAQMPEGFLLSSSYVDREGNYWFGTQNNGLYRARKQIVTPYTSEQGLSFDEVYPVLESRDGTQWFGGTGLAAVRNGTVTNYAQLPTNNVSSLLEDRSGRLWINGRWRFEAGQFVRGWSNEIVPDVLNSAWTMYEDNDGTFWVGTMQGVVRIQNNAATHFTAKDGLAGDDTKVIVGDGDGGVWLGSYGGLTHYKGGAFRAWTEREGLPSNTVRALKQDADGTLWIGTYDGGLGRFKAGQFTRYTAQEGLFDNGVFQILEDDYGWFWMSCNRGIYRVRKQELTDFAEGKLSRLTSVAYGKSDGMPSAECNGGRWPAGGKARDGKLWFPTMHGLVVIDPANLQSSSQPPPVLIEEVRLDNQAVAVELLNSALIAPYSAVSIGSQQSNFEIQYTALSFINSENLRFKYKLEGLDRDWVEAGTRRTAYFSHIPPGEYTFRVIAANRDGVWNTRGPALRIVVVPPIYRTWWFMTLVVLTLSGLFLGAFRYRVAQLQAQQAVQQAFSQQLIESQEAERKRIAGELHDSLGQNLIVIKNWATLGRAFTEPDAPVREQLDEISTTALQSLNDVRSIIHNLRPYQLDTIGLSNTLRFMVEQVSAASGLQFQSEIAALDNRFAPEAEVIIFRIVQECVNNIIKHAQATEAKLLCKIADDNLQMTISDNGRGLAHSQAPQSTGLGLTGLSERVRILGGTHKMQSAAGQGTTHFFTIPIPVHDTATMEEKNGDGN